MPDRGKMYVTLFHSQTQAIELLEQATQVLKKAQEEAEEIYLASSDDKDEKKPRTDSPGSQE